MSSLSHLTRCVLCPPETPFEISAHGFEPLNLANPQFPPRIQSFIVELSGHIQKTAEREGKRIDKARKNGTQLSPLEAARLVAEQGKHLTAFQTVILATQWTQGFCVLNGFDTQDPELQAAKDGARALLHSLTARRVPDEVIQTGVAQLGFDGEDADSICRFVRELLDASNGIRPQPQDEPLVKLT